MQSGATHVVRSLREDLARLRSLAFKRLNACGDIAKQFHAKKREIALRSDRDLLWRLYDWLTVPLSLWPIDFAGAAKHALDLVNQQEPLDDEFVIMVQLVGLPPNLASRQTMGAYEHDIARGRYEKLVRRQEKFDELERGLKDDQRFNEVWSNICRRFDIKKYQNSRGVIRRLMSKERNFREDLAFQWRTRDDRFRVLFDALCYHWNLYGIERKQPLLLKMTVNLTPHGTMIFIPRYWSLDLHRDLKAKEISRLHRAHGGARQGPKLSPSRLERLIEARKALAIWNRVTKDGIRGDKRYVAVLEGLNKDSRTDFSHVKRLLQLARKQ
ncbi:hypothetical protein AYO41_04950 [Verrucomicrobia bacterium SCGC AG-212-E04]|nr:hypothetical protein AYO41_04950 [Verrucomicrobia bacterium SCGC AG-212-E04]